MDGVLRRIRRRRDRDPKPKLEGDLNKKVKSNFPFPISPFREGVPWLRGKPKREREGLGEKGLSPPYAST